MHGAQLRIRRSGLLAGTALAVFLATSISAAAAAHQAGKLQIRDDVYGLDRKLMSILGVGERRVADVAIERPADPNFKPTAQQGAKLRNAAAGGGEPQLGIFGRLFR